MHDPNAVVTINANLGESVALAAAGNQLIKGGLGELILTGTSVYTGLTTVSGGILHVTNALAIGAPRNEGFQRITLPLTPAVGPITVSFTAPAVFGGAAASTPSTRPPRLPLRCRPT